MSSRTSALAAAATALALLFSACGGGGGDGRPSVSDLADEIKSNDDSGEISDEQAECIARAFVDSDISDEGLRTLADSGNVDDIEDLDVSDEDKEAATAAVGDVVECVTGDIELPEDVTVPE